MAHAERSAIEMNTYNTRQYNTIVRMELDRPTHVMQVSIYDDIK